MDHSVSQSDLFDSIYYSLNKKLLVIIGQWPYQAKYKSICGAFIQTTLLISLFIPQGLGMWKYRRDVDTLIECLSPVFVALVTVTLIQTWTTKRETMKQLLEDMRRDWEFWLPKPEVEILRKYAMHGRTLTVAYATYIYTTALTFISLPMIPVVLDWIMPLNESRPKIPLYIAEYYVDQEKYFYLIMAQDYVCSITCTSMIVIVETMFMVFTQHACGMFAIIGFKLQNLIELNVRNKNNVKEEIIFCIKNHRKIITFVDNINDSFSMGFFVIMGLNMIVMSVTGVQTVLKLGQAREVIRYGLFTASQMFHFFFLSVPGQNLIDHSLDIRNCIYNGRWYELPLQYQKLLLFIMRRTLEPCEFVAGILFKFSMQTFASVVRMSMSYFTVLSSLK